MSAGLILHRLELCEDGDVVGAVLLTARDGVVVAEMSAIGRDGYNLVRVAKRIFQAASVKNTHEKGE